MIGACRCRKSACRFHRTETRLNAPDSVRELEISHVKLRATFLMVADLGGSDPDLFSYLQAQLEHPQRLARKFELIASCLTRGQLGAAPELHASLLDTLEVVLERGDAGEFDELLKGIGSLPDILSGSRLEDLRCWVLVRGSRQLQRRALQIVTSTPLLSWRLRGWLWEVVRGLIQEARISNEVQVLCDRFADRYGARGLAWLSRVVRLVQLSANSAYLYAIYLLSLFVAQAGVRGLLCGPHTETSMISRSTGFGEAQATRRRR